VKNPIMQSPDLTEKVNRIFVSRREIPAYACEIADLEKDCESPIELLLGIAMLEQFNRLEWLPVGTKHIPIEDINSHFDDDFFQQKLRLFPQVIVGPFRVDFVAVKRDRDRNKMICLECDGHEFHKRTKDEAEKEAFRDRYITSRGLQVVRFTGREIWRDALGCADQACRILFGEEINL